MGKSEHEGFIADWIAAKRLEWMTIETQRAETFDAVNKSLEGASEGWVEGFGGIRILQSGIWQVLHFVARYLYYPPLSEA
jgi:hypothetical protein